MTIADIISNCHMCSRCRNHACIRMCAIFNH